MAQVETGSVGFRPQGSYTEHYPELGTGPVNFEDCISPEFYELERKAVFKRCWLMVGRVEHLPRKGSYFTKELEVANASVIVVRGKDDQVRAFHNICRHRGNKLVWSNYPREETSGTCRQFSCKYHGWKYALDGECTDVVLEDSFFDIDKKNLGLIPVNCEVWEGFIFIHLGQPSQSLLDFLGPMVRGAEGFPFHEMTERYRYKANIKSNWKLFYDAFQEIYHGPALHGNQTPNVDAMASMRTLQNPYYEISGPHRMFQPTGTNSEGPISLAAMRGSNASMKPIERLTKSSLIGPYDGKDHSARARRLNPGGYKNWFVASFNLFPNTTILIRSTGWYMTYSYWPTSYNTCVFEGNLYFPKSTSVRQRIAHEVARATHKEFALQDANSLEATQIALESRVLNEFPLSDHEILCRHLHKEIGEWVSRYVEELGGSA